MRRRSLALASASLALVFGLYLAAVRPPVAAAQEAPFCQPGEPATFQFGIAELRDRLGDIMGSPLECEHVNAESGDTVQQTSTGLAYYRPSINMAISQIVIDETAIGRAGGDGLPDEASGHTAGIRHPPHERVRVEDDHRWLSQSLSPTGIVGASYLTTLSRSTCRVASGSSR